MRRTPVLLQSEVEECGLACLAMIASHLGHTMDVPTLRDRCRKPALRLRDVLTLADTLALDARAVRVDIEDLDRLALPALLHWQFDHYVVLTRVRRRTYVVHDPAIGRRSIRRDTLQRSFTGVAVQFSPRADFARRPLQASLRLRDFAATFTGWAGFIAGMLTLLLVSQLLLLALPIATQLLIDEVLVGREQRWFVHFLLGTGCVMLAAVLLEALRRRLALTAGVRFSRNLGSAVVSHLFSVPVARLARRSAADLISRIDSLQPIQHALTDTLLSAIVQSTSAAVTLTVMLLYSAKLSLVAVAMVVVVLLVQLAILPQSRASHVESLIAGAAARHSLIETLRSFATVRVSGYERARLAHWRSAHEQAIDARARQGVLAISGTAAHGAAAAIEQLLFLYMGIGGVLAGQLTLGTLFAMLALRVRFQAAVLSLAAAASELYLARAHVDRVGDIVRLDPEPPAPPAACRKMPTGAIECDRVSFGYDESPVLHELSIAIDAGERVVVCGATGSGKSTLLKLLATELYASQGAVRFDDLDVALWDRQCLRRHIGFVRQNERLLGGSIADNVSGFEPLPDMHGLRRALQVADVWRDVEALPLQLQTPLLAGDARLSGGQLQRLVIARAVYRVPKILLLDEATNQLDTRTEARVLGNLAAMNATIVSVAHRDSAIACGGRRIDITAHGICGRRLS